MSSDEEIPASPVVRRMASRLGVNLRNVTGTGVDGRIRTDDVRTAYNQWQTARAIAASLAGTSGDAGRYPLNPAVDTLRSSDPQRYHAALRRSSAPTLFAAGDLPPFTASGMDPNVLRQVPWQARHPVAAASSTAEAYALVQRFSDPVSGETDAAMTYDTHPANVDYQRRVQTWVADSLTDDQLHSSLFGQS
ncbi:E3 binding domain-containing protein [Kineococcus terrestris]|uniref:E3 binding domain-containing protein n=1 Tax=Kineococcus terrestris TaxID=2044856 RepID=UPI0034DACE1A